MLQNLYVDSLGPYLTLFVSRKGTPAPDWGFILMASSSLLSQMVTTLLYSQQRGPTKCTKESASPITRYRHANTPNKYRSWGLFLLAQSCFGEFLLALGQQSIISVQPLVCRIDAPDKAYFAFHIFLWTSYLVSRLLIPYRGYLEDIFL